MNVSQDRINRGLYWQRAWSLVNGCSPVSPGCLNCWSAQQAHVRGAQENEKIRARYGGLTDDTGKWTGEIRLMEQDLGKPRSVKRPMTWAIWNDLFHPSVPFEFIRRAFAVMWINDRHTFLILTKRPKRMAEFFVYWQAKMDERYGGNSLGQWPLPNVWLGITAENQATADERIPILLQAPAAIRYVSIEPMLEIIDLDRPTWLLGKATDPNPTRIDWVICGSETGPHKRPMELNWARLLKNQCQAAGIPFFFKQDSTGRHLLDGIPHKELPGQDILFKLSKLSPIEHQRLYHGNWGKFD